MTRQPNPALDFKESHKRKIIWLLCLLAVVRVFFYSAAFPLFNNVDEPMHFDLVVKYSATGIPHGIEPLSDESLNYIVLFSTSEYFVNPTNFPNGQFPPPPWTQPVEKNQQSLAAEKKMGSQLLNYEDVEPPIYYKLTSLWWQLGKWCDIHDGFLPYWLRFLNTLFVAALVWIAFVAAKVVFPENTFVQIGAPALLAFMPQTAFYSISNDVLPPVCFGLAFICLLFFYGEEKPSIRLGILTGLALAATFLAKMTDLPILAVSSGFILLKIWQIAKNGKLKSSLPSLAALFICAALPMVTWMAWCKHVYGDFTGSPAKTHAFGYTVKPFVEWWHHPIFTPAGFWIFLSGQFGTFWQGEFRWDDQPMALPGSNIVYTALSLILLAAVFPSLLPRFSKTSPSQRHAIQLSLACFLALLVFFAFMSIIYDFHNNYYPSRQHPFFISGRMLLGALVPFLLTIVYGLDRLLDRFGKKAKFIILAAIITGMFVLEIVTDWPVFNNPYNWFHLP